MRPAVEHRAAMLFHLDKQQSVARIPKASDRPPCRQDDPG